MARSICSRVFIMPGHERDRYPPCSTHERSNIVCKSSRIPKSLPILFYLQVGDVLQCWAVWSCFIAYVVGSVREFLTVAFANAASAVAKSWDFPFHCYRASNIEAGGMLCLAMMENFTGNAVADFDGVIKKILHVCRDSRQDWSRFFRTPKAL